MHKKLTTNAFKTCYAEAYVTLEHNFVNAHRSHTLQQGLKSLGVRQLGLSVASSRASQAVLASITTISNHSLMVTQAKKAACAP